MKKAIIKLRNNLCYKTAVSAMFLHLLNPGIALAKDDEKNKDNHDLLIDTLDESPSDQEGYTINFNNVSALEYIRFISKITNLNFVFDEADLQFNVTIVSEEPISKKNIMSTLVQVLRIHDLSLLEQDNNILITNNKSVNQISTIVSSDIPSPKGPAPIVTRIFRLKNANPASVASIIRPMMSAVALVEISAETHQLIITDITTNVDKIAALLASLDAPHTPLEIDSYIAKVVSPPELIALATQIVSPFAEGNPLIFVPQLETGTIFIVSTPYLIERAMTVMEDLDVSPKGSMPGMPKPSENIYVYKVLHRSGGDLQNSLNQIGEELKHTPAPPEDLIETLQSAKWIKESNSILFIGDSDSLSKIKEILISLDIPGAEAVGKSTFYIYKVQHADGDQIEASLKQMADNLEHSAVPDRGMINALRSGRWIKESNSLIFTGDDESLKRIGEILPTLDIGEAGAPASTQFYMYNPKYRTGDDLVQAMRDITNNLKESGLSDPGLIRALNSMKWVPNTNSLLFTGDPASLASIKVMIGALDVPTDTSKNVPMDVFIYSPKYITKNQVEEALSHVASDLDPNNLADQRLAKAIDTKKWVDKSNSFIFKADPNTLTRIKELMISIDTKEGGTLTAQTFYLYKLQNAQSDVVLANLKNFATKLQESGVSNTALIDAINNIKVVKETNSLLLTGTAQIIDEQKEIISQFDIPGAISTTSGKSSFFIYKPVSKSAQEIQTSLTDIAADLQASGLIDPDLLQTITTMRYVESTNSLLFTGSPESLEKVKELIAKIDSGAAGGPVIQQIGQLTFFIYKLQYVSAQQLMSSLKAVSGDLQASNSLDKDMAQTINTMKWIKETNSILFTGPAPTLEKVEGLIKKFDIPSLAGNRTTEIPVERETPSTFVLYKPQYQSGEALIGILHDFEQNLINSGVVDKGLYDAINNLKWIDRTSSILISGDQASIAKVQELLQRFDIPGKQGPTLPSIESIENTSFLIYKLQYHQGGDIQTALKQVATDLAKSGSNVSKALVDVINSLQWVRVTNSLLGTGDQDTLARVRDLIQNLDIPLRQVFIEILVIQTTLTDSLNFGLSWGGKVQYLNKTALSGGNFPLAQSQGTGAANPSIAGPLSPISGTVFPKANNIPFTNSFDLGVIGDIVMHKGQSFISMGSLVTALQVDADATILLNPKIITQDNNNSNIFVGSNIPFVGSLITQNGLSNSTATNLEYRDVGVNLSITPTLGNGEIVTLDISNDISQVLSQQTITNTSVSGITTSHTSMNTKVHVPNKHFLILSGMIQDTKTRFRSGLPCLGGLPVIGAAFSENDKSNVKNNIVIFVRPHIIDSFDEYKELTENQENLYKEQAGRRVLKEEFDVGIDMVKAPDNE